MSRSFRLFVVGVNLMALLVNLFVGLLVYQNPVVALLDANNLFSLLLFASCFTAGSYILYLLTGFLEHRIFSGRFR